VPHAGDYISITVNDEPLLVVRDDAGEVIIMSAVCQHRGYVLGDARGTTRAFNCPFHGWCYDLHGRLVGAPEMSAHVAHDALASSHSLPRLRSEIWNGFVFVNFDGTAPPLAPRLKRLTAEVANHHMADMGAIETVDWPDNPWNWKFMHENAIEPHHTWYLHKGVHDFAPSTLASFVAWDDDDDGAIFHPTGFLELDANFNAGFISLFPVIPTLTERERKRVMFACVLPNLFFGAVPDGVFYYFILPQGANKLTIRVGLLYPPTTFAVKTFDAKLRATITGIMIYNDQDTVANTRVHQGLRSRFANRSRYAPKEKTLAQMNRWLIKRYLAYARAQGFDAEQAR
jgi:phenylpropionate dioxygenase-like ring-hydroxylating dioxygenase large terminal subunit